MTDTTQDWEKVFDKWWEERFGDDYTNSYVKGDIHDFISQHFIPKTELVEKLEGMKTDIPSDQYLIDKPLDLTSPEKMGPYRMYNQALDDVISLIKGEEK